jgi:hypothetical protein
VQTFIRLLVPLAIACGGDPTTPAQPDAAPPTPDGAPPVGDAAITPPVPEILAMNESDTNSIAVYLGDVYWTTDPFGAMGQVKKLVPGGTPVTLAAQENRPTSIAVGPGFLEPTAFWVLNSLQGRIRQIATTGAPPLSSAEMGDAVYSLALDGNAVFAGTRGAVKTKGLTNTSTVTTLADGYANGVLAIDADATGVVFSARTVAGTWIVASVARTGGTVTTLHTGPELIRDVEIVGSNVFFLDDLAIKRVPRSGGGSAATLTTITENVPWALASSGAALFVATNRGVINPSGATGQIIEIDATSGTQRVLAKDQAEPSSIAVDASFVYWTNRGVGSTPGQVVRLARE